MYVILCYDVNVKCISKVRKICLKHLKFTQKSVYEGQLRKYQLNQLKSELKAVLNPKTDQVVIYKMESTRFANKEMIGKLIVSDNVI